MFLSDTDKLYQNSEYRLMKYHFINITVNLNNNNNYVGLSLDI